MSAAAEALRDATAARLAPVLVGAFAVGAVLVLVAQFAGRVEGARLWRVWAIEWLTLAAVFVPAWLGPVPLGAAALLLTLVCTSEAAAALGLAGRRPATPLVLLANAAQVAAVVLHSLEAALLVAGVAALLALGLARAGRGDLGASLLLLGFPGLGAAHLAALGALPFGFGAVVLVYGVSEVTDSSAFLLGSAFGRRRVFPRLSPNKTLEGLVAGVACGALFAPLLAFTVPGLGAAALLAVGLLIALLTPCGDLLASALKRAAGIKDFAHRVPTHGGVLDVYDALLFVSAPAYHALSFAGGRA